MLLLEQQIIRGSRAVNDLIELTALDILTGHVNTGGVYFFPHTPDIDRMKKTLAQALDIYPSFGASLLRSEDRYFLNRNNIGIAFSCVESDAACPRFDDAAPVLEGSDLLDPDVPMDEIFAGSRPLTCFRLTLFRDGSSALGVRNIHSQADGAAMGTFMHCWAALYNGIPAVQPCDFSRSQFTRLACGDGIKPSRKLSVIPAPTFSIGQKIVRNKETFGAIYVELERISIKALVDLCKAQSEQPISSSDVIHGLIWKAFAAANGGREEECKVFTVCDIRSVPALKIPPAYEGNALIERAASASFSALLSMSVADAAMLFRCVTKPLEEADIREDLAYLTRQYNDGQLKRSGNFRNLVRGSIGSCFDSRGVLVNDMRFLSASEISFGEKTRWRETMFSLCFNMVAVYHTSDDKVAFRYVGERDTLAAFARELEQLALEPALDQLQNHSGASWSTV